MKSFIKDMLSGGKAISSKRVAGLLALIASLVCIVYLTIKEGGTPIVESLVETALIISTCLLGVSTVTNIWKNNKSQE